MKKLMALIALVAMVAVSSVAFAQETTTFDVSVDSEATFVADCKNDDVNDGSGVNVNFTTDGSTTTLALTTEDQGTVHCQIFADANNANGFDVDVRGTQSGTTPTSGLYSSGADYQWTPLATAADVVAGTEAWGYRLSDTTAAANGIFDYTVNGTYDSTTVYNPMSDTENTVISETGPVNNGAYFYTDIAVASDDATPAGTYQETVTLTQTVTP